MGPRSWNVSKPPRSFEHFRFPPGQDKPYGPKIDVTGQHLEEVRFVAGVTEVERQLTAWTTGELKHLDFRSGVV